jgi:hypothetical protein
MGVAQWHEAGEEGIADFGGQPTFLNPDGGLMMALVVIAFCWAHKTGEWKHQVIKPLKIKNMDDQSKACFAGLGYLTHSLLQGLRKMEDKFRLLLLFIWPPEMVTVDEQNPGIMVLKI